MQVTTDGSANLATAINEGAPADVFASADESNLQKVIDEGLAPADGGTIFVTNLLQIVVGEGNPLGIDDLEDLTNPDVALSLCQEEVPVREVRAAGLRGRRPPRASCRSGGQGVGRPHQGDARARPTPVSCTSPTCWPPRAWRASTWPTTSRSWPRTLRRC